MRWLGACNVRLTTLLPIPTPTGPSCTTRCLLSVSPSLCLSLSGPRFCTLSLTHFRSLSLTHTLSLALAFSLARSLSRALPRSLSFSCSRSDAAYRTHYFNHWHTGYDTASLNIPPQVNRQTERYETDGASSQQGALGAASPATCCRGSYVKKLSI